MNRESKRKLAYTVREAAGELSISRSRLYELIHSGEISSLKIGRLRRITDEQLTEFLAKQAGNDPSHGSDRQWKLHPQGMHQSTALTPSKGR